MTEETPKQNPTPETHETSETTEPSATTTEPSATTTEPTATTTEPTTSSTQAQASQYLEPIGLIEAFKARHSVRTFQKKPFPQQKKQMIAQIVTEANSLDTPFESHVEISMTGPGLGRMNAVSNEAGFLVQKIPINEEQEEKPQTETPKEDPKITFRKAIIDASFKLQVAVMKMTQYHISTVWIGGTYNEGLAEERFPDFKITAVVAFGEEDTPHFMARVMKFFGSSDKRLPFQQLFYDSDNKRQITENDFNENKPEGTPDYPPYMKDFLVSLQSGPSALNQQGWRFVLAGNGKEVHLFDAKGNSYSCYGSGIALANLHLLGEIRGGECTIEVREPAPEPSPLGGTYIATAVYTE